MEKELQAKPKLDLLQLGRAMAAILVLMYHLTSKVSDVYIPGYNFLNGIFRNGQTGVDFFFVLSGFIIYYTQSKNIGKKDRASKFIFSRLARVYPIYLFITITFIIAYVIFPDMQKDNFSVAVIIKSLLLIPQTKPIDPVAWTLSYEMLFYLMFFSIILFDKKKSKIIISTWVIITLLNTINIINVQEIPVLNFLFSNLNLEFIIGCFSAYVVKKHEFKQPVFLVIIGTVIFFIPWSMDIRILYAIGAMFIVIGFANMNLYKHIRSPKLFVYLGDASYSIYLSHWMSLAVILKVLLKLNLDKSLGSFITVSITAILSIGVSCFIYSFIEKPLTKYVKAKIITKTKYTNVELNLSEID